MSVYIGQQSDIAETSVMIYIDHISQDKDILSHPK